MEFDFYGLCFNDRHTYHHYKELKEKLKDNSIKQAIALRHGEDDYCVQPLICQLSKEGYETEKTGVMKQYCREEEKEIGWIYLSAIKRR